MKTGFARHVGSFVFGIILTQRELLENALNSWRKETPRMIDEVKLAEWKKHLEDCVCCFDCAGCSELIGEDLHYEELVSTLDALLKIARCAQETLEFYGEDGHTLFGLKDLREALSALNPVDKKETP